MVQKLTERRTSMFEDAFLTVVLLLMLAIMAIGMVAVTALNRGTRKMAKERLGKKSQSCEVA